MLRNVSLKLLPRHQTSNISLSVESNQPIMETDLAPKFAPFIGMVSDLSLCDMQLFFCADICVSRLASRQQWHLDVGFTHAGYHSDENGFY